MKTYRKLLVIIISLLSLTFGTVSFAESSENDAKNRAIEKYLQIAPIKEMMDDMTLKIAKTMPEKERANFIDMMSNKLDINLLESSTKKAMYKHFTLSEIEWLLEFYSKPEGRSVMKKMGDYMAEVMPVIQAEIIRIYEKPKIDKMIQEKKKNTP